MTRQKLVKAYINALEMILKRKEIELPSSLKR
jgi:hypothetical protein